MRLSIIMNYCTIFLMRPFRLKYDLKRKITISAMLEALSRFNVQANIKRDINSTVAANLIRKRNGRKNTVDWLRVLVGRGKCAVDAFYFTQQTCRISVESGARSRSHFYTRHFLVPLQLFLVLPPSFLFLYFIFFLIFLTYPETRKYFTRTDTSTQYTRASAINDSANIFCWDAASFLQTNISKNGELV